MQNVKYGRLVWLIVTCRQTDLTGLVEECRDGRLYSAGKV